MQATFAPPTMQADATAPEVRVVFRRVLAAIIDGFLVSMLIDVLGRPLTPLHVAVKLAADPTLSVSINKPETPFWPVSVTILLIYFTGLEYLFSMTIGKAVAGLRVVMTDGSRPGFLAVLGRNVLRPVEAWGGMVWLAGLVIAFSPRRQRIGDLLAGTLVADARSVPATTLSRRTARKRALAAFAALLLAAIACDGFSYVNPAPVVADPSWSSGTPSVFASDLNLTLPSAVGGIVSWRLGSPRQTGPYLVYPLDYDVSVRHAPGRHSCHATVRLRRTGLFALDQWQPYDLRGACLGQNIRAPL